ncbi:hypothetical protein [Campylobacter sp. RM12651]|uniref:hypothetical protein n=1 Tax=Campylobacter sp. RM12651 TaxID=1660079 RepID=UPI001EFB40D5|nr:hypothetical protein [Campylobacter sp. RM12651]ULO03786.1 putative membrane protein [Campylobacter sp. RM12651]
MINLFIDYIIAIWQDPLVDFETLLISATLGAIPFVCACIFTLHNLSRVSEKIVLALASIFTLMFALTYIHKLIILVTNGYSHVDLLKFFAYLSGSISSIIIAIAYAKKTSRKTIHFHKNGITKEYKIKRKNGNNNDY